MAGSSRFSLISDQNENVPATPNPSSEEKKQLSPSEINRRRAMFEEFQNEIKTRLQTISATN